tara:strand:- start:118 stop:516 length:399 start_codon:yes stop_codon:yes gene_type:complete
MKLKEILLIDDNYVDNYISQIILEKEDLSETITVKLSAMEALDYLKNKVEFPQLVFLDIRMPAMDGFEFLDEFSKFSNNQKAHCDIVMLSSSNSTTDMEAAKKNALVLDYLSKPLCKEKIASVFELLAQKKA